MPDMSDPRQPPPEAVIFDMDGTLTVSTFDFDVIRREIGLPLEPRSPILEALATMTPDDRQRAEAILHRHEFEAARNALLQDQAVEVVRAIRHAGLPVALLTRNSHASVNTLLETYPFAFDVIRTREDGAFKPSPEPILTLCRQMNARPEATWSVGDFLYDLQAGIAAGAITVLMMGDDPEPEFAHLARHKIRRLTELLDLLGIAV